MPGKQHTSAVFSQSLILAVILMALPASVFALGSAAEVPENAHENNYGSGWECDPGFRMIKNSCAAITVPVNAYPTDVSFGQGWECNHGYRQLDETCVAIKVPENGYLDASGDRWLCNRGYRLVAESCVGIIVPENGYLTNSWHGYGWACDRGFRQANESCLAVKLPKNAHLDYSGNDWQCNRPYHKEQDGCALP
jgi:hypothetical protein